MTTELAVGDLGISTKRGQHPCVVHRLVDLPEGDAYSRYRWACGGAAIAAVPATLDDGPPCLSCLPDHAALRPKWWKSAAEGDLRVPESCSYAQVINVLERGRARAERVIAGVDDALAIVRELAAEEVDDLPDSLEFS